jgi:uncharacterized protein (DUF697 family)
VAEPTSPIALIYKELYERYEELKTVSEWLDHQPRLAVVGCAAGEPRQLFEALFGAPEAAIAGDGWQAAANFALKDVPGLGAVGDSGDAEQALAYLRESDFVLLTLPAEQRPEAVEQGLMDHLKRLKKPCAVIVTQPSEPGQTEAGGKVPALDRAAWDTWVRELQRVFGQTELQRAFGPSGLTVLPARRLATADLAAIVKAIHDNANFDNKYRLAFTAMVRHQAAREALVKALIDKLSTTAMWLGLSPIPFSDVAAITPLQVLLVCRVAACYGQRLTPAEARRFVLASAGVGAVGFGFRSLFRLITSGLGEGLLPLKLTVGATLAWSGTQLVGRAARLYYQRAGHLSAAEAGRRARAELAEEGTLRRPFGATKQP